MKLGEIKIEALKLMFVNYNIDISIDGLNTLELDENYGSYIVNMQGAINRCFSSLEEKRVLPIKSYVLQASDGIDSGSFTRFNLVTLIYDYFDIDRITYSNSSGEYIGDLDYQREGDVIVINEFENSDSYIVLYKPKLERITTITSDEIELSIPENIATSIPYFIKGDLYRDDEPGEASEARNWYETAMDSIVDSKQNKLNKVVNIYKQTE